MKTIISEQNKIFIESAIQDIYRKIGLTDLSKTVWNVCGSYVINMQNSNSDLDLMAIGDDFTKPEWHYFEHQGIQIHLTAVPTEAVAEDGIKRGFGAYFTGKIINPHLFFYGNEALQNEIRTHAGNLIGELAGYIGSLSGKINFKKNEITAQVFIAYLSTDPSFDSYFLSYFVSPEFEKIWEALCNTTVETLIIAGEIKQDGYTYRYTKPLLPYKEFHTERMKVSARHWSFGSVCHGGNYKFPDGIYENAQRKIQRIDPFGSKYQAMVEFLKQNSGLDEVFI